jgi:tRNA A-37 threonylcarbamoyl transferase component Bud32
VSIRRAPNVSLAQVELAIEAHDRASGERVLAEKARRRTTRVPWDGSSDAVVKERRHGLARWIAGLWVRLATTRAFADSTALRRLGVAVAEPLANVVFSDRSFFLSRWVEGERLDRALARALDLGDEDGLLKLCRAAAELAASFHASDHAHGDLKPQNIIIDTSGRLVAIDLDDVTECEFDDKVRDLAALDAYGQRGERRVPRRVRLAAFRAYVARARLSDERARAFLAEVAEASLDKRARWRRAGA